MQILAFILNLGVDMKESNLGERPVYLRQDIWQFLKEELEKISDSLLASQLQKIGYQIPDNLDKAKALEIISNRPGPFLYSVGIIEHPELLQMTVIELKNYVEYYITLEAAEALRSQNTSIELITIYDHLPERKFREEVLKALSSGYLFDQLTLNEK